MKIQRIKKSKSKLTPSTKSTANPNSSQICSSKTRRSLLQSYYILILLFIGIDLLIHGHYLISYNYKNLKLFHIFMMCVMLVSAVTIRYYENLKVLRFVFEIENVCLTVTDYVSCDPKYYYEADKFFVHLAISGFWNLLLSIDLEESLFYYSIQVLSILLTTGHLNYSYIRDNVKDIFNLQTLKWIYVFVLVSYFVERYTKDMIKIMNIVTLYKSKFYEIKTCFENNSPLIILKKQNLSVIYRNKAAEMLFIEEEGNAPKADFNKLLAEKLDLIHFEMELNENIINNKTFFIYPISKKVSDLANIKHTDIGTFYSGEFHEGMHWLFVRAYIGHWGRDKCIVLQLEEAVSFTNDIFQLKLFQTVNEEMKKLCYDLDMICYHAPPPKETEITEDHLNNSILISNISPIMKSKPNHKNIFKYSGLSVSNKSKPLEKYLNKNEDNVPYTFTDFLISNTNKLNKLNKTPILSKEYLNEKDISKSPHYEYSEKEDKSGIFTDNEMEQNITSFDENFLYLMSYNINHLYDMYLTLEVFHTLRNGKLISREETINFRNFLTYYKNYIRPLAEANGYQIEFIYTNTNVFDNPITIKYIYFRVMMFNILQFIFQSNTKQGKNKELKIKIDLSIVCDTCFFYKMIYSYDISDKRSFQSIKDSLEIFKEIELKDINLSKLKGVNFGLMVSYFIANSVFSKDKKQQSFEIRQNKYHREIITTFSIPDKVDYYNTEIKFPDLSCQIYEKAIGKIVEKMGSKEKVSREERESDYRKKYEFEEEKFNEEEEMQISFKDDMDYFRQNPIKIKLLPKEHPSNPIQTTINKPEEEMNISLPKKLFVNKIIRLNSMNSVDKPVMRNKIKSIGYFSHPFFLILADNIPGDLAIIKLILQMKGLASFDIVQSGVKLIKKFKFFLQSRGCIYDFIIIDINFIGQGISKALKEIRKFESIYLVHTKIIFVGKINTMQFESGLFDKHFPDPSTNPKELQEELMMHLKALKPDYELEV